MVIRHSRFSINTPFIKVLSLILIPYLIFCIHSYVFRNWLVDDAGISFAYARNLACSNGLVAQPGSLPVEGFSNFLWVLLISFFYYFNIFHLYLIPKLISLVFVLVTYYVISKMLFNELCHQPLTVIVALSLLSLNTSFVAWQSSGLEIPLYLFAISWLALETSRILARRSLPVPMASALKAGVLASTIALTRPDGLVFFIIYPIALLIRLTGRDRLSKEVIQKPLLVYLWSWLILFGAYFVFRIIYFGDFFPNTYYAKGCRPFLEDFWAMATLGSSVWPKIQELMSSVLGTFGNIGFVLTLSFTIWSLTLQRVNIISSMSVLPFLVISLSIYLLMPKDWMPEYRFAAPFFVFFYIWITILLESIVGRLSLNSLQKRFLLTFAIAFVLLGYFSSIFYSRTVTFARNAVIDLNAVARDYGERFNRYAALLNIQGGSILLPDIGGTLLTSNLKVCDLAGLCDKQIAGLLYSDPSVANVQRFHEYVFETLKPTFIHMHDYWALRAQFHSDPRFSRDYVPISENKDSWIKMQTGLDILSGDYVRRDVVAGNIDILRSMSSK